MIDHTANGQAFKVLNIIDEYTRECLAMMVAHKIRNQDVIELLFNLFIIRGILEHIRSDNAPEFTARAVRRWLNRLGVKTLTLWRKLSKADWEFKHVLSLPETMIA
jgi:putative transposase